MRFKQHLTLLVRHHNKRVSGGSDALFWQLIKYDAERNDQVQTAVGFNFLGDWANRYSRDVIRSEDAL